jgi:peptidoglycan/LPS O-acetylase OafA/YrhL
MLRRRLPSAVSAQEDNLSRFDDRLRRISTALFGAGMIVVLLVANSQLVQPQPMGRLALNYLVLAAGISVVLILLFPWRRYNRNLFLVSPLAGLCLIALAAYFSGGWDSPFFPFYFFVVVFCAIYFLELPRGGGQFPLTPPQPPPL